MTESINIVEAMRLFLKERGYDGLCGRICGCGLDDLFPYYSCNIGCAAAYRYAYVRKPELNCPEYAKCAKSDTGCLMKGEHMNINLYWGIPDFFFADVKKECRCRRPYANQEAGND
jgi:hypothetical protein